MVAPGALTGYSSLTGLGTPGKIGIMWNPLVRLAVARLRLREHKHHNRVERAAGRLLRESLWGESVFLWPMFKATLC